MITIEEISKQIKVLQLEKEKIETEKEKVDTQIGDLQELHEDLESVIKRAEQLLRKKEQRVFTGRMGRPKGSSKYSKEQRIFLRECAKKGLKDEEIIESWNKEFDDNVPSGNRKLYNLMDRQNLLKIRDANIKEEKPEKVEEESESKNLPCPYCNSNATKKSGLRKTKNRGKVQRYFCEDCGKRFTEDTGKEVNRKRFDEEKINEAKRLRREGVTTREIGKQLGVSNTTISDWTKDMENVKRKGGPPTIFTKKVIDFMRLCASKNMIKSQALDECQKEFKRYFNKSSFGQHAFTNNIHFLSANFPSIKDIPEEIQNFVRENSEKSIYQLRDEIIEKFEINYSIKKINSIIMRFKINADFRESEVSEVKRIKQIQNENYQDHKDLDEDPFVHFEE